MKTLIEVEERTDLIRLRVTEIFSELKNNSDNPLKVISLADELEALLREYSVIFSILENINELTEMPCSGPH